MDEKLLAKWVIKTQLSKICSGEIDFDKLRWEFYENIIFGFKNIPALFITLLIYQL